METGWLIEKAENGEVSPENKALGIQESGLLAWGNYDDALRFARKEDAERFGKYFFGWKEEESKFLATEHSWS